MKKIFSGSFRSISYIFQVSVRFVHIWGRYAPLKAQKWRYNRNTAYEGDLRLQHAGRQIIRAMQEEASQH